MIYDHTWTKHGMHVACWLDFLLQDVYQFESPRLLDMSNCLSRGSLHIVN
jgi:hypothetical protein